MENDLFMVDEIIYHRYGNGRTSNMYHAHMPMFRLIEDHEAEDVVWPGVEMWCTYCEGSGPPTKGSTWNHIMERVLPDDNRRAGRSLSGGHVHSAELGERST